MVKWKLKACPRCKGDTFIAIDLDGWYEQCLQCSYRSELKKVADSKEPPASNTNRKKQNTPANLNHDTI